MSEKLGFRKFPGFTLAIIFVVAVFIVGGFLISSWVGDNKSESSSSEGSKNSKRTTANDSQTTKNTDDKDPTEDGKYFVIKEWGVRFVLPEEFRTDLTYYEFDPENIADVIRIVSEKYSSNRSCNQTNGGFLGLHMEDTRVSEQLDPPKFKQIGNMAYYFTGTACQEDAKFEGEIAKNYIKLEASIRDTLETF